MFAKINSLGLFGMNAFPVDVEIDASKGVPSFEIVGLPDVAIKESRERIRSAIKSCGVNFPLAKVTVNLAPADTKKSGSVNDLPILIAVLKIAGALEVELDKCAFIGELSLNGEIRPVNGVLPMVLCAKATGIEKVFVPKDNAYEASVVEGISVYGVENALELMSHLIGESEIVQQESYLPQNASNYDALDYADVKGQQGAKRALEIAAAGGHNAILIGPPGSGKSMLAKRLPSILPAMTFDESIETTQIHSICGHTSKENPLVSIRPFRSPHHTISTSGLSGGGTIPRPGEISLAHNGVLFLDELPEFNRNVLEILRQPLEDQKVTISRAMATISYPCSIMLIAAMNPCQCGYFGHPTRQCICTPKQVGKYLSKVSGPMLDRLDLHIEVAPVEYESISSVKKEEASSHIRHRVQKAREIQNKRYSGLDISCNARLTSALLHKMCPMTDGAQSVLKAAFDRLGLSARAYDRILKVSRTIADLEGEEVIDKAHIAQAIQYRSLDRKYWGA